MKSVRYYEEEEEEEEDAVVEEEAAAAQSSKNSMYLYPKVYIYLSELYNSTDFARLSTIMDLTCLSLSSNS